uniref:Metalloendopeptidase n=1 Tax=Paramormyrops kingsleyae TaxID=1676925 RepID=A0A3B3SBV5_9TELE
MSVQRPFCENPRFLRFPLWRNPFIFQMKRAAATLAVSDSHQPDSNTLLRHQMSVPTELRIYAFGSGFREGDIAVSNKRGSRSCFARSCLWPKSVDGNVYIAYTLSPEYRMEAIENGTCIRFVPQTHQNDYLDIQPKSGCWSYLGFHGGPQIVSLQAPECVTTGVTSHELMHALGFVHEQSRADRDKYVTILWEHVQKFEKYKTNNLDTPYDYASIMHFGKYAYSEDGDPTIIAKGNLGAQLGQRFAPSELDKFKINKLYKCGECCVSRRHG